jgi:hypothetical protein
MEQERLIAGAIYAPEHLAAIRQALAAEDIVDLGLQRLYDAILALSGQGLVPGPEGVARAVADDPDASAALAGLDADLPFHEWVPDALRHRETRRAEEARRQAVLQWLAGPDSSAHTRPPDSRTEEP